MTWEILVTGSKHVLEELADVLKGGSVNLDRRGDGFVLRTDECDKLDDPDEVRSRASETVQALSSVARLALQSVKPLQIGSVSRVRPDGCRDHFLQVEPAQLRITGGLTSLVVTRADGSVEEHRAGDPISGWLSRASADPNLLRALRLRDADLLSWSDLYRLFEVIEASVGGETVIVQKEWASRSDLRRFRHSANSVSVAGDEARHGVERQEPPAQPMCLADARTFIDGLLRAWLSA